MTGASAVSEQARRLPVRVRRVEMPDGRAEETTSIYCPKQRRSIGLSACSECVEFTRLYMDPVDRGSFVSCIFPRPDDPITEDRDAKGASAERTAVGEIMTSRVLCVTENVRLDVATLLVLENNISGMPVVDASGRAVGVLSKSDLLRERYEATARNGDGRRAPPDGESSPSRGPEATGGGLVGRVMMPVAFTVPETAPVSQAAALMAFEGIHRVPVVSEEDIVVGILSALDVLRWLAKENGYLLPGGPPPLPPEPESS